MPSSAVPASTATQRVFTGIGPVWQAGPRSAAECRSPAGTGLTLAQLSGAQVTGLFDLSPSSVPSREVHDRSTAGTWQVSQRSAETGAAPTWEPVHPWPAAAFCRPCAGQAGAAGCPAWLARNKRHGARRRSSATVQGDTPRSAGFPGLPADPVGYAWARPSTISDLPGPGRPFTEDG